MPYDVWSESIAPLREHDVVAVRQVRREGECRRNRKQPRREETTLVQRARGELVPHQHGDREQDD